MKMIFFTEYQKDHNTFLQLVRNRAAFRGDFWAACRSQNLVCLHTDGCVVVNAKRWSLRQVPMKAKAARQRSPGRSREDHGSCYDGQMGVSRTIVSLCRFSGGVSRWSGRGMHFIATTKQRSHFQSKQAFEECIRREKSRWAWWCQCRDLAGCWQRVTPQVQSSGGATENRESNVYKSKTG